MSKYTELENRIGYHFKDEKLLLNALTHSSFSSEHGLEYSMNNERLEFIGDGFLDAIVGAELYKLMPTAHEGALSKNRAEIVCEESLAEIARQLDLGESLELGRGEKLNGGKDKNSILADAMEAIIGASIIDGGYEAAETIVLGLFRNKIDLAVEGKLNSDYKSKLQELLQDKYKSIKINYVLVHEEGPDHDKVFNVDVVINDKILGSGSGKSKAKAEQAAAENVLSKGEI